MNYLCKGALLLVLPLLTFYAYGQKDKVYLNNGSVLYGEITGIDGQQVSLTIQQKHTLNLDLVKVQGIKVSKKSRLAPEKIELARSWSRLGGRLRLRHWASLGAILGYDDFSGNSHKDASFSYIAMLQKNRSGLGIGVNVDYYDNFSVIPYYIYYRGDLAKKVSKPFYYMSIGHSTAFARGNFENVYQQVNGRGMIALGLGYEWRLGKSSLVLTTGWKSQKIRAFQQLFGSNSIVDHEMKRLELRLGVIF